MKNRNSNSSQQRSDKDRGVDASSSSSSPPKDGNQMRQRKGNQKGESSGPTSTTTENNTTTQNDVNPENLSISPTKGKSKNRRTSSSNNLKAKNTPETRRNYSILFKGISIVVAIAAVIYYTTYSGTSRSRYQAFFDGVGSVSRHGEEYIEYPWVTDSVPRIYWSQDEEFAKVISDRGLPVILMNTTIEKWRARQYWSPKYISENTKFLEGVQRHPNKTFTYFHDDHPMSNLKGISDEYRQSTYERVNMTSRAFFEAIAVTPPYHYYAAPANELGRPYHDLYPIEPLMVKNATWKPEMSYLHRWTNVWFGPGGSTTHTHYDISHNFYAQIYGKKRFVLFPPEEYINLYLYPFLHPGGQQSQVSFDAPDYAKFPNFKNAKAVEAILNPGDVLYLPPLWFHHVSALTTSMSISVWTKYPETQRMYQTVRSPLPLRGSWSKEKIIAGGRLFINLLIEELDGKGAAKPFVKEVLENRFNTLIDKIPNFLKPNPRFDGPPTNPSSTPSVSFCTEDLLPETEEKLLSENEFEFRDFINKQAKLFNSVENRARRNIWLGNLVEQLAMTVAGVENVANFLTDFVRC